MKSPGTQLRAPSTQFVRTRAPVRPPKLDTFQSRVEFLPLARDIALVTSAFTSTPQLAQAEPFEKAFVLNLVLTVLELHHQLVLL